MGLTGQNVATIKHAMAKVFRDFPNEDFVNAGNVSGGVGIKAAEATHTIEPGDEGPTNLDASALSLGVIYTSNYEWAISQEWVDSLTGMSVVYTKNSSAGDEGTKIQLYNVSTGTVEWSGPEVIGDPSAVYSHSVDTSVFTNATDTYVWRLELSTDSPAQSPTVGVPFIWSKTRWYP